MQHSVRSLGANKLRPALASLQSQAPETGRMNCQYQLLVLSVLLFLAKSMFPITEFICK